MRLNEVMSNCSIGSKDSTVKAVVVKLAILDGIQKLPFAAIQRGFIRAFIPLINSIEAMICWQLLRQVVKKTRHCSFEDCLVGGGIFAVLVSFFCCQCVPEFLSRS